MRFGDLLHFLTFGQVIELIKMKNYITKLKNEELI